MNTFLLATDGSPSAAAATTTAIDLAKATGWKLHVVSVWHTLVVAYGYAPVTYGANLSDAEREHARSVLEATMELARDAGISATTELRSGDAVEEICKAASEVNATLVVVGAHGWGPVRRVLFGSVSTGVLHEAPCPVLVVRGSHAAPKHEREAAAVAP